MDVKRNEIRESSKEVRVFSAMREWPDFFVLRELDLTKVYFRYKYEF